VAHAVDGIEVGEVERHQRRRATGRLDGVVELFQAADGARHGDDVRALGREASRHRRADAARRAGDERNSVGQAAGGRGGRGHVESDG
jgi:hypothetical protein